MEPAENKTYRDAHLEDLIDHYWGSLNHISSLIKASEIKAGLILSFYGILLNFIYESATSWLNHSVSSTFWYLLPGLWAATTIISIFSTCAVSCPGLKRATTIIFFSSVILRPNSVRLRNLLKRFTGSAWMRSSFSSRWVSRSISTQKLPAGNLVM